MGRQAMCKHRVPKLCSIIAASTNDSQAVLGLWVNLDDRVLIAPGVADSVPNAEGQWRVLNFQGLRRTQTAEPTSRSVQKRRRGLAWRRGWLVVKLSLVALHSRVQLGANLPHLGEALFVRVLYGKAAL